MYGKQKVHEFVVTVASYKETFDTLWRDLTLVPKVYSFNYLLLDHNRRYQQAKTAVTIFVMFYADLCVPEMSDMLLISNDLHQTVK